MNISVVKGNDNKCVVNKSKEFFSPDIHVVLNNVHTNIFVPCYKKISCMTNIYWFVNLCHS